MLESVGFTQSMNFYSIKDGESPSEISSDRDFFVGRNMDITLTISNEKTIQVRDVVVLGKLTIKSDNMERPSTQGSLIARDIFVLGNLKMNYVKVEGRNAYQSSVQKFKQELQDILIDWFKFQRESAEQIGLKSVLI